MATRRLLFVFDFDDTLVSGNSDTHVFKAAPELDLETFHSQLQDFCWQSKMDKVFEQLHKGGYGENELTTHMGKLGMFPGMLTALRKITECQDAEMMIMSDANTFNILSVLKKVGLDNAFSHVITNPAHFDEEGRLHIEWYHTHKCERCHRSPNLCKGSVLKQILASGSYTRVVYVGDGGNDTCPSMLLSDKDHVVARKFYRLDKNLNEAKKRGQAIPAQVHTLDFTKEDLVVPLFISLLE